MHQETPAWGTPLLPCAGSCRPAGTGDKSPHEREHQGQQYGRQTGLVVLAGRAGGSVATECPPVPSPASPGSSAEFCAIQLPARRRDASCPQPGLDRVSPTHRWQSGHFVAEKEGQVVGCFSALLRLSRPGVAPSAGLLPVRRGTARPLLRAGSAFGSAGPGPLRNSRSGHCRGGGAGPCPEAHCDPSALSPQAGGCQSAGGRRPQRNQGQQERGRQQWARSPRGRGGGGGAGADLEAVL